MAETGTLAGGHTAGMAVHPTGTSPRLPIGDFARMTHLSVKALRHYHDLGLLEPARIDPSSGYRFYSPEQVPVAQVVRRLRDLDMPLEQIRAVLRAPDVQRRNSEIAAHLDRMQSHLERTAATVAGLRALLSEPGGARPVEFRTLPPTAALAIRERVTVAEFEAWWVRAFGDLYSALDRLGLSPTGPAGALYPGELFETEQGEVTAFVPVRRAGTPPPPPGAQDPGAAPRWVTVPGTEAAVMVHEGSMADLDRTYGALGTVVAERSIGVDGPIREYYLVGPRDSDDPSEHRTEVAWPVFRTGRADAP